MHNNNIKYINNYFQIPEYQIGGDIRLILPVILVIIIIMVIILIIFIIRTKKSQLKYHHEDKVQEIGEESEKLNTCLGNQPDLIGKLV